MRCLTVEEARAGLPGHLAEDQYPKRGEPNMKCGLFYFGDETVPNTFWIARRLVESLGHWEEACLWLNQPDTWKRNGFHLYNRLRQSYGDYRLVTEAPVHQFYGYEQADLCSFVAVALINEWSFYLFSSHDYGRLFVSQSSGAQLWVGESEDLAELIADLKSHRIAMSVSPFQPLTQG